MFVLSTLWLVDFFPLCSCCCWTVAQPTRRDLCRRQRYFDFFFFCQMQLYIAKINTPKLDWLFLPRSCDVYSRLEGEKVQGRIFVSQYYKSSLFSQPSAQASVFDTNNKCNSAFIFPHLIFLLIFLHSEFHDGYVKTFSSFKNPHSYNVLVFPPRFCITCAVC